MGRHPSGEKALTNSERQARHRRRQKAIKADMRALAEIEAECLALDADDEDRSDEMADAIDRMRAIVRRHVA